MTCGKCNGQSVLHDFNGDSANDVYCVNCGWCGKRTHEPESEATMDADRKERIAQAMRASHARRKAAREGKVAGDALRAVPPPSKPTPAILHAVARKFAKAEKVVDWQAIATEELTKRKAVLEMELAGLVDLLDRIVGFPA